MTTQTGKITVSDGASIAWALDGPEDAPVIVLSNSLGTTRDLWIYQLPFLMQTHRVLRYDTRGHGLSDAPQGAYGLDRLGRDVVDLLEGLHIAQADFCGVSLGGMTGQWLAMHAPEKLRRVVLANTAAYMGPPSGWQGRIETILKQGMGAIAEAVLERWFTPEFRADHADKVGAVRQTLLSIPPQGYAGCCAAIRDMDMRPVLRVIDKPVLVINGLRDPATPPAEGELIAKSISGAKLAACDGAHLSNIEQADAFNAALRDFLN